MIQKISISMEVMTVEEADMLKNKFPEFHLSEILYDMEGNEYRVETQKIIDTIGFEELERLSEAYDNMIFLSGFEKFGSQCGAVERIISGKARGM